MARSKRIMVKLSLPMEVSLCVLSERMGLTPATVAFMRLREALQRTADTDEVQRRVGLLKAQQTRDEWIEEQDTVALQMRLSAGEEDHGRPD